MDVDRKERLNANLAALPRSFLFWVMSIAGTAGTVWQLLPDDQKRAVIEHSPLPIWTYPIVLTVSGIVKQIWPRKAAPSPDEAAALFYEPPIGKDRSE